MVLSHGALHVDNQCISSSSSTNLPCSRRNKGERRHYNLAIRGLLHPHGLRAPLALEIFSPSERRAHSVVRAKTGYRKPRVYAETNLSNQRRESVRESPDNTSVWDSNAEGIRWSWKTRKTSLSELGNNSSSKSADVSEDVDEENNWQWWLSGADDDAYDEASADEDDDGGFDILSAISLLRWMLPAAALFLPWLFGGPMLFMMTFAFFPLAQKLLGYVLPVAWKVLMQGWNSSRSKRKQYKESKYRDMNKGSFWAWLKYGQSETSDELRQDLDFYSQDEWARTGVNNPDNQGKASKMAGWDDLEEDFLVLQKRSVGTRSMGLRRRRKKKETPLFFRLVIAFFPFLRSWGGFL